LDAIGKARSDLGPGEARPLADIHLAQVWIGFDREAETRRNDLGRLRGATEVARVDGVGRAGFQLVGELLALSAAEGAGGGVGVAVKGPLAVQGRPRMPHQEERCHRLYASRPWTWACETRSASSRARRVASASRRRGCWRRKARGWRSRGAAPNGSR